MCFPWVSLGKRVFLFAFSGLGATDIARVKDADRSAAPGGRAAD